MVIYETLESSIAQAAMRVYIAIWMNWPWCCWIYCGLGRLWCFVNSFLTDVHPTVEYKDRGTTYIAAHME